MKISHSLIVLILTAAVGIGCQKKEKVETASKSTEVSNELPSMPITFSDGTSVQVKAITGSLILVLFQPDCDHCQREAEEFKKNLAAFSNYSLYFVSAAPIADVEAFAKSYELSGHANVKFGVTTVENILNNFGAIPAPSVYIYNGSGQLVKKFNGETDIQQILESI